jgi:tetratricopeptide (TPR) repeat protein
MLRRSAVGIWKLVRAINQTRYLRTGAAAGWRSWRQRSQLLLLLAEVALSGAVAALPVQAGLSSEDSYVLGRAAFARHDYGEAAALMAKAEAKHPAGTDALLFEGRALERLSRFGEADRVLHTFLESHPVSIEGLTELGVVEQRENQPSASLESFSAAARLRTPTAEDLRNVALDYVLLDDYPDAILWLQRVVRLDPQDVRGWYDLGRCYYTMNRFGEAESAFERAAALDPDGIKVQENLGLALDMEGRSEEAERAYRRAVELARKSQTAGEWPYLDYGVFLLSGDRAAEAVPLLASAAAANPQCAKCHEELGRALSESGRAEQGVEELKRAAELAPDDAKIRFELGQLYKRVGDSARAREQLGEAKRLYEKQQQRQPAQ